MQNEIKKLQEEMEAIKLRNKKVEADKAWETSWTRKILIALITYVLIVLVMTITKFQSPFKEAIVPSIAYLLSMSVIPVFKQIWIKNQD